MDLTNSMSISAAGMKAQGARIPYLGKHRQRQVDRDRPGRGSLPPQNHHLQQRDGPRHWRL